MERQEAAELVLLCADVMDMVSANPGNLSSLSVPTLQKDWDIDGYIVGTNTIGLKVGKKYFNFVKDGQIVYGLLIHRKSNPSDFVIAIRGTRSAAEWKIDLFFDHLDFIWQKYQDGKPIDDYHNAGAIHKGFQTINQSFVFIPANNVTAEPISPAWVAIHNIVNDAPKSKLTVSGHSLGAPLAVQLTAQLATGGINGEIRGRYFASPRIGSSKFVEFIKNHVRDYREYNNINDIVPSLPPSLFGAFYQHLDNAQIITEDLYEAIPHKNIFNLFGNLACAHHAITYAAILNKSIYTLEGWKERLKVNHDDEYCITSVE